MSFLGNLLLPSHLAALLFIAGLLAWLRTRTRPWCLALMAAGFVLALGFASGGVARALLHPLEHRYPAWIPTQPLATPVETIVVLTGWSGDDMTLPASSRLNDSSAFRVIAAAELWRHRPQSRVLVTGLPRAAEDMAGTLRNLGVPADRITLEIESTNTYESVRNCVPLLKQQRFALVTSAGHLPRSMALFEKAGLMPVPIPTDYRLPGTPSLSGWLPSPKGLAASDLAIHEYLGIVGYRMRGWL